MAAEQAPGPSFGNTVTKDQLAAALGLTPEQMTQMVERAKQRVVHVGPNRAMKREDARRAKRKGR